MYKNVLLIPIIALTTFFSFFIIFSPIHAASPSPTTSPSPTSSTVSDQEAAENAKKRIQAFPEPKESKPTHSTRGYIGIVKDVIKDTVIIEDKDGKKDIKLQDDTAIIRSPGNATIKAENIRIDDYIIAIGYLELDETLVGRRLIVSADPIKSPTKTSGIGTIRKIGKSSITLKLADNDQEMAISTKTVLKSTVGTIELADLEDGDTIIFTATVDENQDLSATILMRTQTASISE